MSQEWQSAFVRLSTDKTYYTPGDTVNGTVYAHSDKPIRVRSLDVYFLGEEKVVIPAGKSQYSSTNDMMSTGLRLLENTTLGPDDETMPFQFQLPAKALPSYVGSYAQVIWRLRAKADIPWSSDLHDEGYLRILAVHYENPSPIVVENQENKPRIRLELSNTVFEPGDVIDGRITILDPGNLRSLRAQAIQNEDVTAQGLLTGAHKSQNRNVTQTLWLGRDKLPLNTAIPFQLTIPPLATSDYRGAYSAVSYFVEAVADIPHAEDIKLYAPFLVGLKPKPAPTIQATAAPQAPPPQTPPAPSRVDETIQEAPQDTRQTVTVSSPDASLDSDAEKTIIQLLSDGSSKELIVISTELQLKNQGFLDLNEVKKLCEDMVTRGQLRRTTEGEYFAKYALNNPSQ